VDARARVDDSRRLPRPRHVASRAARVGIGVAALPALGWLLVLFQRGDLAGESFVGNIQRAAGIFSCVVRGGFAILEDVSMCSTTKPRSRKSWRGEREGSHVERNCAAPLSGGSSPEAQNDPRYELSEAGQADGFVSTARRTGEGRMVPVCGRPRFGRVGPQARAAPETAAAFGEGRSPAIIVEAIARANTPTSSDDEEP